MWMIEMTDGDLDGTQVGPCFQERRADGLGKDIRLKSFLHQEN
jgi:hypothetical protein